MPTVVMQIIFLSMNQYLSPEPIKIMPISSTTIDWSSYQWSPSLPYERVRKEAEFLCQNPDYFLDQRQLGICGPVAVLHALATSSKEDFMQLVERVYNDPKGIPNDVKHDP